MTALSKFHRIDAVRSEWRQNCHFLHSPLKCCFVGLFNEELTEPQQFSGNGSGMRRLNQNNKQVDSTPTVQRERFRNASAQSEQHTS
jgi:hypothetical protein